MAQNTYTRLPLLITAAAVAAAVLLCISVYMLVSVEQADRVCQHSFVDWQAMSTDPNEQRAAVFTPYNLVLGGGERYLLSVVTAMQRMGYSVDVLVEHHNKCKTKLQLLSVANGLRVDLDPQLVRFRVVQSDYDKRRLLVGHSQYSLFMALGNEKTPLVQGIGHVNFYMCQFPFDLDRETTRIDWLSLSTYDYVLLNSEFTMRWYSQFSSPYLNQAQYVYGLIPQIVVLHPPVKPFHTGDGPRKHIVLLGRFFAGRQSKGHATAIRIFKQLHPYLPRDTELHLVGHLMPGHRDYMASLESMSQGWPIKFHVGKHSLEVESVLQSAFIQWHLTGAEFDTEWDPASEEHFGISIVEGMTAGTIPVVLDRGGVRDIVQHSVNGFLASNTHEVAKHTLAVFQLASSNASHILWLRQNAIGAAAKFDDSSFMDKLTVLAVRGKLSKPFRHLILETRDDVYDRAFRLPRKAENAAVIIEPRQHYAFEYVVKNVLYHLRGTWSLYVYHGLSNEQFVRSSLASIKNVKFCQLGVHSLSIPALNQLLLSSYFWQGIDAKRALLFQTDSLLLRDNIDSFLQYDYVGAPWHTENERWRPLRAAIPEGVGNGGLSLRSVDAMLALTQQYEPFPGGRRQEDVMFSLLLHNLSSSTLPARPDAYNFCVEVPCSDLLPPRQKERGATKCNPLTTLPEMPTALHAAWYYFTGTPELFNDLITMLETSVCGLEC